MIDRRKRFIRWLERSAFPTELAELASDARNAAMGMNQKGYQQSPLMQRLAAEDLTRFRIAYEQVTRRQGSPGF